MLDKKNARMLYSVGDVWYELDIEELDKMHRWINSDYKTNPPRSMVKLDPPPPFGRDDSERGFF